MKDINLIKQEISKEQNKKVKLDLGFLTKLLSFVRNKKYRVVVSGGYGVDGALGEITRFHNDLDVIIFAQGHREKTTRAIKNFIKSVFPNADLHIHYNPFTAEIDVNTKGFGANIYLVETIENPFENLNLIRLSDGNIQKNSEKRFPLPVKGKLLGLEFEVENPNLRLADILSKRNPPQSKKYKKHEQDIENLKQIVDRKRVKYLLQVMSK